MEESNKKVGIITLKNCFILLIIAAAGIYILSLLFYLSLADFKGTGIDDIFQRSFLDLSYYGYLIFTFQVAFFFAINRIAVLLEKQPGRNENETILKLKKSSAVGFFFGLFMLITFFLFVDTRYDIIVNTYIYDASKAREMGFQNEDLYYAGVWLLLFGTFFMLSIVFTNFYLGRLISYYASQKKQQERSSKWNIFQALGIIWSIQFLIAYFIPNLISLIIHGVLVGTLIILLVIMMGDNLGEIKFTSILAQKRRQNDAPKNQKNIFRLIIRVSMLFSLILVGGLWFLSTAYYARNKAWYDWTFYLAIGIILLLIPTVSLFYAKYPASQWVLKKSFLIIALISLFYFILAIFSYTDLLNNYIFSVIFHGRVQYLNVAPGFIFKPGQYVVLFLLFLTSMVSLVGLKKGLLPTSQPRKQKIREYFNVLKLSKPSKVFLLIIGGSLVLSAISYEGMGGYIVLENDKDFTPRVSFWEWDDWSKDNDTLDIFGANEIVIYGGHPYGDQYKANMTRYYDRGVWVRPTGDNYAWIDWIKEQKTSGFTEIPVDGFIEDIEDGGGLYTYNRTQNLIERSEYEELIDYVHQQNFTQHFTAMHTTINDQLDGDLDMSIFHEIHSFPPLDWDTWNWMIYRTESATHYEEESPYFTYIWVKELKDTVNQLFQGKYDDRLSVSVGVVEKDRLYGSEEDGWDQFMKDMIICDYLKIPEIVIFNLGDKDEERFLGMWGNEGVEDMMEELREWDNYKLYYSRSATFMGNIKYLENPFGSVFGNYWIDIFLNDGMLLFGVAWAVVQSVVYALFIKENIALLKKNSSDKESSNKKAKEVIL